MKKIMALYDLSPPSRNTIDWALRVCAQERAGLVVVHVIPRLTSAQLAEPHDVELIRFVREEIERTVQSAMAALQVAALPAPVVMVSMGRVLPTLLGMVATEQPDLVIVGTHGRSGVPHFLLGSVAEKIVRHVLMPVLLARGPAAWPPRRMLVPVDIGEPIDTALRLAHQVTAASPAHADVLHVIPPLPLVMADSQLYYDSMSSLAAVSDEERKSEARQQLAAVMTNAGWPDQSLYVEMGPPAQRICAQAKALASDLIVLPTHGRGGMERFFLGSVAEQVVRYAPCAVLTICPPPVGEQQTCCGASGRDKKVASV